MTHRYHRADLESYRAYRDAEKRMIRHLSTGEPSMAHTAECACNLPPLGAVGRLPHRLSDVSHPVHATFAEASAEGVDGRFVFRFMRPSPRTNSAPSPSAQKPTASNQ